MDDAHVAKVAEELSLGIQQVGAAAGLLEGGGTVPFIARYRKEATGSLDEVAVTTIRDRLGQLAELDKRRRAILKSLRKQGVLTGALEGKVAGAETMAALEDVYLPFRPKRRTRATDAREKGLEPLAERILAEEAVDPEAEAAGFVDAEKGVGSVRDAIAGARDIIAERISEDGEARARIRELFEAEGVIRSGVISGKEEGGTKYKDYFEWEEPIRTSPSHRILAMRRGEKEGFLTVRVVAPEDRALGLLEELFVKGAGPGPDEVRAAIQDGYRRLLGPSIESETRFAAKRRADAEAIRIFTENLRQLLLAPPLGQKNILAMDPGLRTGCKLVCLDRQGALAHTDTVYPGQGEKADGEAAEKIRACCDGHGIEAIAIGNGTGGRELETFVRGLNLPEELPIVMVDESGASVYSASKTARQEFPDQDVTVRGSVSIGRRLMDPLAELVKIEPKSIGVGQYQHDVNQRSLKGSLGDVVMSCVNAVGVEVNTASKEILTHVSGLGPQLAANIVKYRDQVGPFGCREELRKVPKLGPKVFEQAAGFLRIRNGSNALDASAVHPESYPIADSIAADLSCPVAELMGKEGLREQIDLQRYVTDTVGLPTLSDILGELARPGRDPREAFEPFRFAEGVEKIGDLKPGMKLPGIVTNITAFGAFVDIGVHQDGLVHVSQLADRYVKDPVEVVKVHQQVTVRVLDVDMDRQRISLSMREDPRRARAPSGPGKQQPPSRSRKPIRKAARTPSQKQERQDTAAPNTALAEAFRKAGLK